MEFSPTVSTVWVASSRPSGKIKVVNSTCASRRGVKSPFNLGPGPLPFTHRLDPADLAENDGPRGKHLPVEGKNRFQQFRLHRCPGPFRNPLRQVQAQRRARRNGQ